MTDLNKLEDKIVQTFTPLWEFNDLAHRVEHFCEVYKTGLEMINRLHLTRFDRKLLMFSAYFHDMFAWSRENHHLLSEEFIRGTCHELIVDNLNHSERILVAGACRRHRASNREPFANDFEEFFNAADRERPKGAEALLKRAIDFRRSRSPEMSEKEILETSIKHVKEKYGKFGYATYPAYYRTAFNDELTKTQFEIVLL